MMRFATYIICIAFVTLNLGCQNQKAQQPVDPAAELQQSHVQPVQTPIPSSVSGQPIVITELSPREAVSLSDGMLIQTPPKTKSVTVKPAIVVVEPDYQNTTPIAQPVVSEQIQQTNPTQHAVKQTPSYKSFGKQIARAHGIWKWNTYRCIQTDIQITFGGQSILQGTLLTDRHAGKVRIVLTDGTVLVFDGKDVWMSPINAPVKKPRFDALTWAYFLAAPFKLNDQGSHLKNMGKMQMGSKQLPAAQLTFDSGIGDSPDDWYILYMDPKTKWLRAMAYIVTYGNSVQKAEKSPHAITFDNYANVSGVILPRAWSFWNWNAKQGITGKPIGKATLSNLQMVYPATNSFKAPQNAVLCDAPK